MRKERRYHLRPFLILGIFCASPMWASSRQWSIVLTWVVICHTITTILRESALRVHDAITPHSAPVDTQPIGQNRRSTATKMAAMAMMMSTTTEPIPPEHLLQVYPRLGE